MKMKFLRYFLLTALLILFVSCEQKKELSGDGSRENLPQKENADTKIRRQKVNSFIIRGNKIEIGMLADDMFSKKDNGQNIFTDEEHIGKDIIQDPSNPNSFLVTHHYKVDNQAIDIIMARTEESGPYRIKEIIIQANNLSEKKNLNKELTYEKVREINIDGNEIKIGQEAYIPQGALEPYFIKNEGNILSTHDSYYLFEGKTYIITYGPGEDGPYVVTDIKVSKRF